MQSYGLKINSNYENKPVNIIEVNNDMAIEITINENSLSHNVYRVHKDANLIINNKVIAEDNIFIDVLDKVEIMGDNATVSLSCKGIAKNNSKIIYRATLDIKKGVKNIKAKQSAKFLILGENVEVSSIPSLDVASREVSCSHSLSISKINPIHLWYMGLHGLAPIDASQSIINGFLTS